MLGTGLEKSCSTDITYNAGVKYVQGSCQSDGCQSRAILETTIQIKLDKGIQTTTLPDDIVRYFSLQRCGCD